MVDEGLCARATSSYVLKDDALMKYVQRSEQERSQRAYDVSLRKACQPALGMTLRPKPGRLVYYNKKATIGERHGGVKVVGWRTRLTSCRRRRRSPGPRPSRRTATAGVNEQGSRGRRDQGTLRGL